MSLLTTTLASAAAAEPAGGAALGEVAIATGGATLATVALGTLGLAHRAGRTQILARLSALSERIMGVPGWSALPIALAGGALVVALVGMYWDISLHIDQGRDAGPLANPAHYLILVGLFGVFAAGFLAIVLAPHGRRPSPGSVRVTRDWYAPLGGVLIVCCAAFSLAGFPLDDLWHRLFGQDVTLWGPTHLMLIGGAGMTLVGMAVLLVEGQRAAERDAPSEARAAGADAPMGPTHPSWRRSMRMQYLGIGGGFLVGLSTFQAEFDFGVPQFALILQPALITIAASVALVSARVFLGPGAALGVVLHFFLIRGAVTVLVGPVLGETTPHFPLYIGAALIVEAIALLAVVRRDPLRFGALAGAAIGTVGLLTEHAWTQVWMPIPWPAAMLPEALGVGLVTGLAGGVLGAWVGAALRAPGDAEAKRSVRGVVTDAGAAWSRRLAVPVACGALLALAVTYGLATSDPSGLRAQVVLADVTGADPGARTVSAEIRVTPPARADDARWLTVTAWQGGGKLVVDHLERVGPGVYRTTEPIPVHGEWKAVLRYHDSGTLASAPLFLPRDEAIPAPEVPAAAAFTRELVSDKSVLQREAKTDVAGWLTSAGYAIVLAISGALLLSLAWGLSRLAAPPTGPVPRGGQPRPARGARRRYGPAGATREAT